MKTRGVPSVGRLIDGRKYGYCLVLLLALLTGCGRSRQQLNVFFYSDYLDPALVAEFERRFDCEVKLDFHEDPESMMAKLVAGGVSTYDIVVPSDSTLRVLAQRGLLAPLRPEKIPNLQHLSSEFTNLVSNPGNRFGVPYFWGCIGLYARRTNNPALDESWSLLFNAAHQRGPFLLMDDARGTIGVALRYQMHSPNSVVPAELAAAGDLLVDAKKRSLGFEGSVGCKNRVLARGALVSMVYNTDAAKGMKEDAQTYFFVPREGSQMYLDFLSIPARAPHRDLAETFINFLLEPAINARLANFNHAATPNAAARPLIDPADRQNPAIYPPPDVMARLEYSDDVGAMSKLFDELWTQVKSK
jgi:spermidine/putrescine transport system substrate-binding protein